MKRNYLTTSNFGGGNSVFTGLTSIFHTSTKRRFLSCQRAIIAVFFAFFASGCTRYEYVYLIDEDEEYYETPSDTTSRDTVKIDFNFTPNEDEDTIEVDLNPGYSCYTPLAGGMFSKKSYDCEKNVLLSPFKIGRVLSLKRWNPINKYRTNGTVTI